jgi:hypothetical protein
LLNVKHIGGMVRFEVQLIPQPHGYWLARLSDGTIVLPLTKRPRVEVARALLDRGADPRSQMMLRHGAEIVAYDTLGRATGTPVICGDEAVAERG